MENKDFVPYTEALALKELGFDEPCFGLFIDEKFHFIFSEHQLDTIVLAPTFSQAFRWFREKYNLGHMINGIGYESFLMNIGGIITVFPMFKTYEEAELACLRMLIELVKTFNPK